MDEVKFKVVRVGDRSDACPTTGACGVGISVHLGEHNTAVWLHCREDHTHGKGCAATLLDKKQESLGNKTPREHLTEVITARAKATKKATHEVEPMPVREVEVTRDGKKIKEKMVDLDLT